MQEQDSFKTSDKPIDTIGELLYKRVHVPYFFFWIY